MGEDIRCSPRPWLSAAVGNGRRAWLSGWLYGGTPMMKVLGQSQIGLTMNTYAHVLPEIERAAVDDARHLFG
jgi:hypothetical protein